MDFGSPKWNLSGGKKAGGYRTLETHVAALLFILAIASLSISLESYLILNPADGEINLGDRDVVTEGNMFVRGGMLRVGEDSITVSSTEDDNEIITSEGSLTIPRSINFGGVTFIFPALDGESGDLLTTNGEGRLTFLPKPSGTCYGVITDGGLVLSNGLCFGVKQGDGIIVSSNGVSANIATTQNMTFYGSSFGVSNVLTGIKKIIMSSSDDTTEPNIEFEDSISIGKGARFETTDQSFNGIAIGTNAGHKSQGFETIAIGSSAGKEDQGPRAISIGSDSGSKGQGIASVAIGTSAGGTEQGNGSIGIGYHSALLNQGNNSIAIGSCAGRTEQGNRSIAIGSCAGRTGQRPLSIAIGSRAGETNQQNNSIIINASGSALNNFIPGTFTVKPIRNRPGVSSLEYDPETGEITYNKINVEPVTWENLAGKTGVSGPNKIALGTNAGNGQGVSSVAIGVLAGSENQGDSSISIGNESGKTNQGNDSISIGSGAGMTSQLDKTIAIGYKSGETGQQPVSIAIGSRAGETNQQNNSIIINASGSALNNFIPGTFTVKPIRNSVGTCSLVYNNETGEISFTRLYDSTWSTLGDKTGINGPVEIALGKNAGYDQGTCSIAIGENSGGLSQGHNSIAIGYEAGKNLQNNFSVAIGYRAGMSTQGDYSLAIGYEAGLSLQGPNSLAVGTFAGASSQQKQSVAIGYMAGNESQGIGVTTVASAVAIGTSSR